MKKNEQIEGEKECANCGKWIQIYDDDVNFLCLNLENRQVYFCLDCRREFEKEMVKIMFDKIKK